MAALRLTLTCAPADTEALSSTRILIQRYANQLLVQARKNPEPARQLSPLINGHSELPETIRNAIQDEVEKARTWRRGGLKMDSFWLDATHLKVNVNTGQVSLWTLQGRKRIATNLGNYQRHLLRQIQSQQGGWLTQARDGNWYVKLHYTTSSDTVSSVTESSVTVNSDKPSSDSSGQAAAHHRSTPQFKPPLEPRPGTPGQADVLERQGHLEALLTLLKDTQASDSKSTGQRALALLELGQTDEAELNLLQALSHSSPDARIHLGLSLLAGRRRNPQARLDYALQGLNAQPDDFTRWWLQCSEARALVELARPNEALTIMQAVLKNTPISELRSRARALYFAQGVYAALDDFDQQDQYAREALRLFDLLGVHGEALSLRLDLAYRLFFQNRPQESHEMIEAVIHLASRLGDARLGIAHLIAAELHLLEEQLEPSQHHLEQARTTQARHASDRFDMTIRAFHAECQWRLGRLSDHNLELMVEALRPNHDFDEIIKDFYLAFLAFQDGQYSQARTLFENVVGGVSLLDGFRLRAHAFLAWIRWREGDPLEAATEPLLQALDHVGGELALTLDATALAQLYAACVERDIGGRRLQRLARKARPVLSIRTFGTFEAMLNQQPLHIRLTKARELLAYLILHGPTSRDVLFTALWDGDARPELNSYFKQAVHALREALKSYVPRGTDPIPYQDGIYSISERFDTSADAQQIETALEQQADTWKSALTIYGGRFLPGLETEWVSFKREELQTSALSIAMNLGRFLERENPVEAAAAYLHATRINPLFESAWEAAIHAYELAGQTHLSRHLRQQQESVLKREFGRDPDWTEETLSPD